MDFKSDLDKDLQSELGNILMKFAERNDFDPAEFCAVLTKFSISLNYDFTSCPIAATGMITSLWESELRKIKEVDKNKKINDEDDLLLS